MRDQPPGVARVLRIFRDARMPAVRRMPAWPCMRSARGVQRSPLQRDRSRGRADMERRESSKSARHARRDGWRARPQAILKYCRHKATPLPAPLGARRALRAMTVPKPSRPRGSGVSSPGPERPAMSRRTIPARSSRRWMDELQGRQRCSEDPARTIEPALFLGRKWFDGRARGRGWPRKGGRRRRVTHGPPMMRASVVAGGQGRLPENQQSGECRRGP